MKPLAKYGDIILHSKNLFFRVNRSLPLLSESVLHYRLTKNSFKIPHYKVKNFGFPHFINRLFCSTDLKSAIF
jgi:hypothetical protein